MLYPKKNAVNASEILAETAGNPESEEVVFGAPDGFCSAEFGSDGCFFDEEDG